MEPDREPFTSDSLRNFLDLAFQAVTSGADYRGQVAAMTQAGVPVWLAARLANLIPILAGRRFLAATGPSPKLADHYLLVDAEGNERAVRLVECPVCSAIGWYLDQLDPIAILPIGFGSCEVVALNNLLVQFGPQASENVIATIEIEAPRMGE